MVEHIASGDLARLKIAADKQMYGLLTHFRLTAGYKKDIDAESSRIDKERDDSESTLIAEPTTEATKILRLNLGRHVSCGAPVTLQQVWLCQLVIQNNWWTTDVDDPCAKISPIEELMREKDSEQERYLLRVDIITYVLRVIQNEIHHEGKHKNKKPPKIKPAFALLLAGYSDKDLCTDAKRTPIAPTNIAGCEFTRDYSHRQPDYAVLRERYKIAVDLQHTGATNIIQNNKKKRARGGHSAQLKIEYALAWTQTPGPNKEQMSRESSPSTAGMAEKSSVRKQHQSTTVREPVSLQAALEQVQDDAVRSAKKPRLGERTSYDPNRPHFISRDTVTLDDIMPKRGPEFLRNEACPYSSFVSDATTAPDAHHVDVRSKEMMAELQQKGISLKQRVAKIKEIVGHKGKDFRGWSYFDQFADGEEINPGATNMRPQERVEYLTPIDCRTDAQKKQEKVKPGSCPHHGVIGIKNPLSPELKTRLALDCNKARHLEPSGIGGDNAKTKNRFYRVLAFLYSVVFFMKNDKKHLRTAPDIAQSELRLMRTANLLAMCLDESTREKSEGRQFYRWAPAQCVCQSVVAPFDGTYDIHGDDSYNHCTTGNLPDVACTSTTKNRLEYCLPPRQLMLVITFIISSLKGDSAKLLVYNRKPDSDDPGTKIGEVKTTENFVHMQVATQDDCLHKVIEWQPRSATANHFRAIYSFRITIGEEQAEAYQMAITNNSIDTTLVHDNYNQTNVLDHIQRGAAIKLVDPVSETNEPDNSHVDLVSDDTTDDDNALRDLLEAIDVPKGLWKDAHKKADEPVIPTKLSSAPGDLVEKTLHSENLSVLRLSKTRVVVRHTEPPDPKKVISKLQQVIEGRRIQDRKQKAQKRGNQKSDPDDGVFQPSTKGEEKVSEYKAVHGQLPEMTIVELDSKGEEIPERTRRGIPLPGDIVKRESLRKELSLPDSNHANTTWNGVHPFLLNGVILVAAYKNDFLKIADIQQIYNMSDEEERQRLLHQIKLSTIKMGGAGGNGQQIGGYGSDFRSQDLVQPTPNSGVPHAQNPSAARNETMQHAVRRNAMLSCWVPARTPDTKYALDNGGKAKYFQYLGMGIAIKSTQDKMDELEAMKLSEHLSAKDRPNCQHLTENHFSFLLKLVLYPPFYDCDRCDPSEWHEIEIHSDGQTRVHKQSIHESLVNPYKHEGERVIACRRLLRDSGQWLNCAPYSAAESSGRHEMVDGVDDDHLSVGTNDSDPTLDAFRIPGQTRFGSPISHGGLGDVPPSDTDEDVAEHASEVQQSHPTTQCSATSQHAILYNSGCTWVLPGDVADSESREQLRLATEETLLAESTLRQGKEAFEKALTEVVDAEDALKEATNNNNSGDELKKQRAALTSAMQKCQTANKVNRANKLRHDLAQQALEVARGEATADAESVSSPLQEDNPDNGNADTFPFLERRHRDVYNIVHYALNTNMNKLGFIEDFVSNCIPDITDGSAFHQKEQIKLPDSTVISLKLAVESAVSINTACAYRALRDKVVLCETEKKINYLPNSGVTANLSQHSRCNPSPCCIRTNDVTTSFFMKVLQECGVWDRAKYRNPDGSWNLMTINDIDDVTFCNILRTAMLFRLTGKVPALERYYQYSKDEEYKLDRDKFYFLIEHDDVEHFLTYVKRSTTKVKSNNPMGVVFASEQYRASMYSNCYESFAAFQHMVRAVMPKFEQTAKHACGMAKSVHEAGSTERPFADIMRRFSKDFSSCVKQEKNKASKNVWIPTQFMLDVGEVLQDPFMLPLDEDVTKGYGGKEGLLGLSRSKDIREKLDELEAMENELRVDVGASERDSLSSLINQLERHEQDEDEEDQESEDEDSNNDESEDEDSNNDNEEESVSDHDMNIDEDKEGEDDVQEKARNARKKRGGAKRRSRKRRKVLKKVKFTIEQRLVKVMKILLDYLLNEVDDIRLQALGLYKKKDRDGNTFLAVWINGRCVNLFDMDHVCCKLYLNLARTVGTRTYSAPRPSATQCWPLVVDNLTDDQRRNFKKMTDAFEKLVDAKQWEGVYGSCFEPERDEQTSIPDDEDPTSDDFDDNGVPEERSNDGNVGDGKTTGGKENNKRKQKVVAKRHKPKHRHEGMAEWTEALENESEEEEASVSSSIQRLVGREYRPRAVTQQSQSYCEIEGSESSGSYDDDDGDDDDDISDGWN